MDDLTPPDGITPDDWAATPLAVHQFIGVLLRQHLAALQQYHLLLQRAMPIQATFHVLLHEEHGGVMRQKGSVPGVAGA